MGVARRPDRRFAGEPHRGAATRCAASVALGLVFAGCPASEPAPAVRAESKADPLERRYVPGETIRYSMTGVHETPQRTTRYTAESEGVVKQREDGAFFEETRWVRLEVDGQPVALEGASADFRQQLSLDARFEMPTPGVGGVSPRLIGPIFDLMTFYVDLHPSLRGGRLAAPGDRTSVAHGKPNSWADGTFVLVGEDCIDFELTLVELGDRRGRLRVLHVAPKETSVRVPAEWMREAVGSKPLNWVQVSKGGPGGFQAAAGTETFDVDLSIARPTGRIERATMDNPVDLVMRTCKDEALAECGPPAPSRIHRRIELRAIE